MDQLYFDGMAICSTFGFPDFFFTFTCNPKWPEIQQSIAALNLIALDRLNIVTRVFKLKLQQLMSDLKDKKILRNVLACKFFVHNAVNTHLTISRIFVVKLTRLLLQILSYPNFVRGPLLDDMRPFFGPCEVLGTHH